MWAGVTTSSPGLEAWEHLKCCSSTSSSGSPSSSCELVGSTRWDMKECVALSHCKDEAQSASQVGLDERGVRWVCLEPRHEISRWSLSPTPPWAILQPHTSRWTLRSPSMRQWQLLRACFSALH